MPDTPDTTSKTSDFLAAAKRQRKIEEQVAQQGEEARAALERQAILDQGGSAADRLREQEEKQRKLDLLVTYAETEIGPIISALESLPADSDKRRFHVTRDGDFAFGGSHTIRCHYADDDELKNGLTLQKEDQPAFRVMFMRASFSNDSATPLISFSDYSRRVQDGSPYPDPAKTSAKDGQDLRNLIGAFVAHATPARLDDIARALEPPAPEPAIVTQSITLRAPRILIDGTPLPNKQPDATQTSAKKPFLKSLFRRK